MDVQIVGIAPVVLAGGGGTRLWPLSRGHYPKQFLGLTGNESLLQQTLQRLRQAPGAVGVPPLVVCNEEHRHLVAAQAREVGAGLAAILLEPIGRNTAPALTVAAAYIARRGDDPVLLATPADHLIGDVAAFHESIQSATSHATAGKVVTFGIRPRHAETAYGYIEVGAELAADAGPGCHFAAAFHEKPDEPTARRYFGHGGYRWNAGIFMMKASVWLAHVERLQPEMARWARAAVDEGCRDGDFFRLNEPAFTRCPGNSIDYAIIEPLAATGGVVIVDLEAGWSDVGSWPSLWEVSGKDDDGNVARGDVCAIDTRDTLVFAEHRLVATLGCDDLVVIETADAVMVADKEKARNVTALVDWLSQQKREERLMHRRVFRPWGSYESIDAGDRFQVKHIIVEPGAALSLQMHHHRAEHWIVVSGTARVTRGDEVFFLTENQSTYIPIGVPHRLENPGTIPLDLIEVQSGGYLGEDDIVRFEDRYNRAG